jgi:hypothetical protein
MAKMRKFSDGGGTGLKKETFGEAFKRNRAGGEKTFEWNGKKYTTETKEEADAKKKKAAPDESSAETARLRQVPKASSAEMESRSKREKEQAVESVNPEDYIGVGAALKALPKLAARAAAKTTKSAPKAAVKREPTYESPAEAARRPRDMDEARYADEGNPNFKRGGKVKKMASGGMARSASSRADGCAIRGKTRA